MRGRTRLPILFAVTLFSFLQHKNYRAAPTDAAGTAELLGRTVDGHVSDGDFVWEPTEGRLLDFVTGRGVIFRATPINGGSSDIFRAFVRLGASGAALSVMSFENITRTPLADEGTLIARPGRAAFTRRDDQGFKGLAQIDLDRTPGCRFLSMLGLSGRIGCSPSVTTVLSFRDAVQNISLAFSESALLVTREQAGEVHRFVIDATSTPMLGLPEGVSAARLSQNALRPGLSDIVRTIGGKKSTRALVALSQNIQSLLSRVEGASENAVSELGAVDWRPLRVPEPECVTGSCMQTASFSLRDAHDIRLVRMDTILLELHFVPGATVPPSLAGMHPAEPTILHPAAAFSVGGYEDEPGDGMLGAIAGGNVLTPPVGGKPTLVQFADSIVTSGTWGRDTLAPSPLPDALLQGEPLDASDSRMLERSALCFAEDRSLIYAWVRRATGNGLMRALQGAGCKMALGLGSMPAPLGFSVRSEHDMGFSLLEPDMSVSIPALLQREVPSIIMSVRDSRPRTRTQLGWFASEVSQPLPSAIPSIFSASTHSARVLVELHSFAPSRMRFSLRAGRRELGRKPARKERNPLLVSIGLGNATRANLTGLALSGISQSLRLGREGATLVLRDGVISILKQEDLASASFDEATDLPLLAEAGRFTPEVFSIGAERRRGAACILEDRSFLVAIAEADSHEPAAQALLEAGCETIVALDRGSHHEAFVHIAGSDIPPEERYDGTTLEAVDAAPSGLSGSFDR